MQPEISEAPAAGIGKLLSDNRFIVPNHQRDYSWTTDEVGQLIEDILGAIDRESATYFLGLMVFQADGDALRVLDGQQRLATAVIALSAIRAWLDDYDSFKKEADKIQSDFIGACEFGETEITPAGGAPPDFNGGGSTRDPDARVGGA